MNNNIGLTEAEVLQRTYEFGKNIVNFKNKKIGKIYRKCIRKKVWVIRNNELKAIKSEGLVPGDVVSVKTGDFLPADGIVLESNGFKLEEKFSFAKENEVYQGQKILEGNAMVKITTTGHDAYLGKIATQVDKYSMNKNYIKEKMHSLVNIIGSCGLLFLLFGFIFSLITSDLEIYTRLSNAAYAGLLMFVITIPFGLIMLAIRKIFEQKGITKKSNLWVKDLFAFMRASSLKVICVDDKFLTENNDKYIQRLYRAGIRIVVTSEKSKEKLEEIVEKSGVCAKEDCIFSSGKKLESDSESEIGHVACETICFYEMASKQKEILIKAFDRLKIKALVFGDNLEDSISIDCAAVGVSTHSKTRHFDYEIADGVIYGDKFSSIYSFIKGGFVFIENLRNYAILSFTFHIPLILLLLIALISKINMSNFFFQTLMLVFVIIPLLMILADVDSSEIKIYEIKERAKKFPIKCAKAALLATAFVVVILAEYLILYRFMFVQMVIVNMSVVLLTAMYAVVIAIVNAKKLAKNSEGKAKIEKKEEPKTKSEVELKKEIKEEKKAEEKVERPKKVKKSKKEEMEDIKGNII